MKYIHILFMVILVSWSFNASAWRCGQKLITVGDSEFRVLDHCGLPDGSISRGGLNGPALTVLFYKRPVNGVVYRVYIRNGLVSRIVFERMR